MFNVYGDDIILEHVKIGELKGGWPGLRARAIDYLEGTIDGYVSEDDHCTQIEEEREEAYKQGEADQKLRMQKQHDAACSEAFNSGHSVGKSAGIKEGWAGALKESAHAAETERVALLLASCNKVYALLGAGLRERKAGDARDKMRAALLELSNAAKEYRS